METAAEMVSMPVAGFAKEAVPARRPWSSRIRTAKLLIRTAWVIPVPPTSPAMDEAKQGSRSSIMS